MIKAESKFKLVLDTKWKCLKPDEEDKKNGVSQADMYQMFAYANQYKCSDVVLLYPDNGEVTQKRYSIFGDNEKKIRVETVNLNMDLMTMEDAKDFREDIKKILAGQVHQEIIKNA